MENISFDVIVIGSGAAGLRAAVSVRDAGLSACVISKGGPGKSTCSIFSGGVMAGSAGREVLDSHLERTVKAGRGLNDSGLLKIFVEEAPLRLNELVLWGINADMIKGYLYARGRPPAPGEEIVRCLLRKNEACGTRFFGNLMVTDVLISDGAAGVSAYDKSSDRWIFFTARAVVIATGGASALYLRTDNPKRILGDGYRLALEAGAVLQDMEFVQFYPLCLAGPGAPPIVIPPRIADRGRLINGDGEDILEKYGITERPAAERARDSLSQALFREIHGSRKNVQLDLRNLSEEDWLVDPFSAALRGLISERYGGEKRPLPVEPAAHHCMGGIKIDSSGATSVPGLFAAGEAAGGLHGANRMGGNALSETLVFGARAGDSAALWAKESDQGNRRPLIEALKEKARKRECGNPDPELMEKLRRRMWEDGGIIRDEKGLTGTLGIIDEIIKEASVPSSIAAGRELADLIELRSSAEIASVIVQAALMRRESRGAHFRNDFPEQDDFKWEGHIKVRLSHDGNKIWEYEPKKREVKNVRK
jgi:fumarate reductase (CoM/CoB) subunit A